MCSEKKCYKKAYSKLFKAYQNLSKFTKTNYTFTTGMYFMCIILHFLSFFGKKLDFLEIQFLLRALHL